MLIKDPLDYFTWRKDYLHFVFFFFHILMLLQCEVTELYLILYLAQISLPSVILPYKHIYGILLINYV